MINRIATELTCNDIWCGNMPWRESCPPKTRFCLNNSTSRWRDTNFSSSVTGIRFAISFRLIPTWSKSSISNFCFVMIMSSGKSWPRNLSQISVVWVFPGYFFYQNSARNRPFKKCSRKCALPKVTFLASTKVPISSPINSRL